MMANYTMTINECLNNPLTPMFNFDYPFYIDDVEAKAKFEEKFVLYYWNCEIGFETFARFQKALQARLTIKMPYYQQLYETELKAKDINFLLNKDLTETTTRELTGIENGVGNKQLTNEQNQNATSNMTSTGEFTSSNQSTGDSKTSQINDGVASASLEDNYLSGVSHDESSSTDNQQSNSSSNNQQESTITGKQSEEETNRRENTQSETTSLISQGNIGITSSAELLQKWREVLINIDEIIIEDCRDLFMRIY